METVNTGIESIVDSDDKYYDLGTYRRPITTSSPAAQTWFNRGLVWSYGFHHEEAASCFEQAIAHDATCAMAYWGLAYCLGPNYNKPWEFFDEEDLGTVVERTHRAVSQAQANASGASPVERALVDALKLRYPQDKPPKDCSVWNVQYADAMRSVYEDFQDDLDVAALYADALMNLTPWQLWDIKTGRPADGARTMEAKAVLDQALSRTGGMSHPGLLHLYIHLMEMSPTPEAAMPAADHLRDTIPDAGHLRHMPSHLDIMCGQYSHAVTANQAAIVADEKFLARTGPLNFYTLYRSHDYHFCIYAAMFSGQSKVALDTSDRLVASIPEALLRVQSPPMADWLEGFLSTRIHVMVRFGQWQDIMQLELPSDQGLYCVTTAMIYYAKCIALAILGRLSEADAEVVRFAQAMKAVPDSRTLFNNKCIDILKVAEAMLMGEVEYRRQNFDTAFEHLRRATALDDALPYDEPWGWMTPTRHAYAALLLEQGRIEEAVAVYSADLGLDGSLPRALQHPNNVWSLHGYHECLVKLGRADEARTIKVKLDKALAVADVPIRSSCFCRLTCHPEAQ